MLRNFLALLSAAALMQPGVLAASPCSLCSVAKAQLPGQVAYASGKAYVESQTVYYTAWERGLSPHCVFTPRSAADVSAFIKLAAKLGGREADGSYKPQFAVRSGGHMLWTGAANIDGGVTVDTRHLNSVTISDDKTMVSVGGGTVWSDIYPQLVPHNLTVIGARVPGVGVGGFTLGGGNNFLSRRHGWSCDNVYGYEVVLANGEIVYATSSSHPDLWLALKGGSNNFGIVTRFDVAAFDLGLMLGGVIAYEYTQSVLDAQVQAWSKFMTPANFDDAAQAAIILGFNGEFSVANMLFYSDEKAKPTVFDGFTSIPSLLNTLTLAKVDKTVENFGASLPTVLDYATELTFTTRNGDAAFYSSLIKIWENNIQVLADIEGINVQFLIQPLPVTNGTNSLGLEAGITDAILYELVAAYTNKADTQLVQSTLDDIISQQTQLAKDSGLYMRFQYLNYAGVSQNPIGHYGTNATLQSVSAKYDPEGLFQDAMPGAFKLF
ncbi:oxidoreductase, fad-binding [Paramyrothecium foliicola]|nr:oxidoreductase, fad-binding [Paramyrothecium foliicola]